MSNTALAYRLSEIEPAGLQVHAPLSQESLREALGELGADIPRCSAKLDAHLSKQKLTVLCSGQLRGSLTLPCQRCLEAAKSGEGLSSDAGVKLVAAGHKVIVEKSAGEGSGLSDEAYVRAGASIVPTAADAWGAEMVVKVKEPVYVPAPTAAEPSPAAEPEQHLPAPSTGPTWRKD